MVRKMTAWPSKRGPITKIMLPEGVKGDAAPLALGWCYDFHEVGGHLGNVGLWMSPSYFRPCWGVISAGSS